MTLSTSNDLFNAVRTSTAAAIIDDGVTGIFHVEEGRVYGKQLAIELQQLGFCPYVCKHVCSVATFETHLKKDETHVEIISSVLAGRFTRVRISEERIEGFSVE